MNVKLKITIKGRVHDVGYRLFLLELADSLLIDRFDARNVKIDGKQAVIVLVEGDEEQLKEFVEAVKTEKPEMADVESIEVEEYDGRIKDIERFRSGFNTAQLSKIVHVGLRMLEKQDSMLEKQDTMLGKMDLMLEKQDSMLEKQDLMLEKQESMLEKQDTMLGKMDSMLEKQDETIGEIRNVGEKVDVISKKLDRTNELLEKRFERLEEEIERIKKALVKHGIDV